MKNLSFLAIFVISCSSLKDIDKPVCVELSMDRGYCTTIISGEEIYVDDTHLLSGKTWFESRPTHIQVPVETWAALKKYLIMNCKRSGSCNENIDSWNRSISTIDNQLLQKTQKQ